MTPTYTRRSLCNTPGYDWRVVINGRVYSGWSAGSKRDAQDEVKRAMHEAGLEMR